MKVSELIEILEHMKTKHGDVEVESFAGLQSDGYNRFSLVSGLKVGDEEIEAIGTITYLRVIQE